jgi:uncharacterized membrane protein HdeD (DUF308 family)
VGTALLAGAELWVMHAVTPVEIGHALRWFFAAAWLVSAAVGVVLGFLLLKEWPLSGLWAIGTLVGINLLFAGFSIISVGSAARSMAKQLA